MLIPRTHSLHPDYTHAEKTTDFDLGDWVYTTPGHSPALGTYVSGVDFVAPVLL